MIQSKGSPVALTVPVGVLLNTHDWAMRSSSLSSAAHVPETPHLGCDERHIVTPTIPSADVYG